MCKVGGSYGIEDGGGREIKMNTSPYSISVYSLATLLNGVEENMSPPVYSEYRKKEIFGGRSNNHLSMFRL
jgi:hypothetical protein